MPSRLQDPAEPAGLYLMAPVSKLGGGSLVGMSIPEPARKRVQGERLRFSAYVRTSSGHGWNRQALLSLEPRDVLCNDLTMCLALSRSTTTSW